MSDNTGGEVPRGWIKSTVGEVFEVAGGGTPSTERADYWEGQIPWITSADIDDQGRITPRRYISEKAVEASATSLVPAGSTIVVTRVGLGKVGTAKTELCFSQDSQALLFSEKHLDPLFVELQMRQAVSVFKHISRGTTISGVTKKQLLEVEFLVAPLAEQCRIVEEIEKQFTRLDAAVAGLKRIKANLRRYGASVLKAAYEGKLVPTEAELARVESREYEHAQQLLARILHERRSRWEETQLKKMSEQGRAPKNDRWRARYEEPKQPDVNNLVELPEGWVWTSIESIGEVLLGRQRAPQYQTGKYSHPYLRVANVFDDYIDFSDVKEMDFDPDDCEKYKLEPSDILINEGQSPELVGRSAIYEGGVDGLCFQKTLHRFRRFESAPSAEFVQAIFRGYLHSGVFRKASSLTVNIAHLTLERIKPLHFPLPPLAEQQRIVAEVERRLSVVEKLETLVRANLKRAERLRQSILKRAFEGNLVAQDPADEPAPVLLARVRAERESRKAERATAKTKRTKHKGTQPELEWQESQEQPAKTLQAGADG